MDYLITIQFSIPLWSSSRNMPLSPMPLSYWQSGCLGTHKAEKHVLYAGITGIAGLVINYLITLVYFEPRPFVAHTVHTLIPHAADASFPSDHTTGALAISIAMLFRNRKIGWPLVIFGLLTGFSRIWVGHHYPVDVLGSLVVAIIIGFLFFRFSDLLRQFVDLIVRIYEAIIIN